MFIVNELFNTVWILWKKPQTVKADDITEFMQITGSYKDDAADEVTGWWLP